MTINELLALNNLTANDQIPVWDAEATGSTEPTAKITAQNFANAVKSLASLIGTGDLDATPTQGSTKAAQSGGVYTAIQQSTAAFIRDEITDVLKPSDYSIGITVQNSGVGASFGIQDSSFEGSGTVTTFKFGNIRCTQIAIDYNGTIFARGATSASTWSSWNKVA